MPHSTPTAEQIENAKADFGEDTVSEVVAVVETSDPDGAWALFSDLSMDTHVECVEALFFE